MICQASHRAWHWFCNWLTEQSDGSARACNSVLHPSDGRGEGLRSASPALQVQQHDQLQVMAIPATGPRRARGRFALLWHRWAQEEQSPQLLSNKIAGNATDLQRKICRPQTTNCGHQAARIDVSFMSCMNLFEQRIKMKIAAGSKSRSAKPNQLHEAVGPHPFQAPRQEACCLAQEQEDSCARKVEAPRW